MNVELAARRPEPVAPQDDPEIASVQRKLAASDDAIEARAAIVLRALLDATGARSGELFGLQGGALHVLAQSADAPSHAVRAFVEARLGAVLNEGQAPTRSLTTGMFSPSGAERPSVLPPANTLHASEIETVVLGARRDGDEAVAAIAALHFASPTRRSPSRALLEALAEALLDDSAIDAVTRVA